MREIVRNFVKNLTIDIDLVDLTADMREPVIKLMDLLWADPTITEARAWGAFPFEDWQSGGGKTKQLAYPYTWLNTAKQMAGEYFPNREWNHWYEASWKLSSWPLRKTLPFFEKSYRRLGLGDNSTLEKIRGFCRCLLRSLKS